MKLTLAMVAVALSTVTASAQTTDVFGPSGQYQGTIVTRPDPFDSFNGQRGQTSDYYGPRGDYQGTTITRPDPFRPFQLPQGGGNSNRRPF
jgi:hypothetical protein